MSENHEFIGRPYSDDEKSIASQALKKWAEESREKLEGEGEKTAEEIAMLGAINEMLADELKSLGIDEYDPISADQVHILSEEVYHKNFPDTTDKAFYRATSDAVYFDRDTADTSARRLSNLMHESVHRASRKKFYVDEKKGIYDARTGYRLRSPWKEDEEENKLRGFNELITDYTVHKLFLRNAKMLEERFGITQADIHGSIYTYMDHGPILAAITRKVATHRGSTPMEVFDTLERGLFTNTLLNLKDVERV